jgi:hypothetical protein
MNQCRATAKATRKQCKRPAILGGTVCSKHGGGAPQVKAKAAERLADLIDPKRALREAARLAYSDIGELFDKDGRLLPLTAWPDHIRTAVSSVKYRKYNADAGDGKQEDIVELKLWDKSKNLEMLFKHMGLLIERMDINISTKIEDRIKAGRDRLAKVKRGNGHPHA